MANFWNLIVQSNTFNFIVMLAILAVAYQKLNLSSAIEKMKSEIIDFIEKSKTERKDSEVHLTNTKKSVENLDSEIRETLEKSKAIAQNVFDEIQGMAQKSVEKIEANVDKIIDNETRKVNTKLSQTTADSAVSLATLKLKEHFATKPELHAKNINEAIETLDKVQWAAISSTPLHALSNREQNVVASLNSSFETSTSENLSDKIITYSAQNYAQALFETGQAFEGELLTVLEVFKTSADFKNIMSNPAIDLNVKFSILDEVFQGKVDEKVLQFVKILIEKNRLSELDGILTSYTQLVREYNNVKEVEIISAIELSNDFKTKIKDKLTEKLNKTVLPQWKTDSEIISGLIFKIGDNIIDISIKNKVESIGKNIR